MLRRSFLMSLAALGLSSAGVQARTVASRDFRTADLMTGGFALMSSQIALNQTANPDLINFANAEIAEQVQVAAALGAAPGSAPLRADHALLVTQLQQARGSAFDRMYVQGQLRGHRELLALNEGAVVELDRAAGAPADLLVNGHLIARGEVVVIDEQFGLRITEVTTPRSRPS